MRKKQEQKKKRVTLSKHRKYLEERRGCHFCNRGIAIDYKDTEHLMEYVARSGKILPRRLTGVCAKHQHALTREIMRARVMALLPYTRKY